MDASAVAVGEGEHTVKACHGSPHGGTPEARTCGTTGAQPPGGGSAHAGTEVRAAGRMIAELTHVPKEFVHKAAADEVMVTDVVRVGDDRFTVAVRSPRDCFLGHRGTAPAGDPLLLAEAVRQTAIYLSHRYHDVPEDRAFILNDLRFRLDAPLPPGGPEAAPVLLEICLTPTGRGRRYGMRMAAEVYADGRRVGSAGMGWMALEPQRYAALRHRSSGAAPTSDATSTDAVAAAGHVTGRGGECRDRDGVLGGAADDERRQLRLDLGHPVLFDHACDHIPGMAILEGFRQAARAASADPENWLLTSADITFSAFGELDAPAWITRTGAGEDQSLTLTAVQGGLTLASVVLSGAPLPAGGAAC